MRPIRTGCTYDCPDACGLVVTFDTNGARLQGDTEHPITGGFLCKRIRKHIKRLNHPERVTEPRIRTGNTWKTASWEAALARVASQP